MRGPQASGPWLSEVIISDDADMLMGSFCGIKEV